MSRALVDIPQYDCGHLILKGFTSMSAYERMPATTTHRTLKCLIVVPTLDVTTTLPGAHESSPTHNVQRTWPAPASLQCLARWGHLPRDCGDCSLGPLTWTSASATDVASWKDVQDERDLGPREIRTSPINQECSRLLFSARTDKGENEDPVSGSAPSPTTQNSNM